MANDILCIPQSRYWPRLQPTNLIDEARAGYPMVWILDPSDSTLAFTSTLHADMKDS